MDEKPGFDRDGMSLHIAEVKDLEFRVVDIAGKGFMWVNVIKTKVAAYDKIYMLVINDEDGPIVKVNTNFDVEWQGDIESCKARLREVIVINETGESNAD